MKRLLVIMGLLFLLVMPQTSWANTNSQYPDPNRETTWNKFTDGMHTMGQTPQQARKTRIKLHTARNKARTHSIYLANKAKRQAWINNKSN